MKVFGICLAISLVSLTSCATGPKIINVPKDVTREMPDILRKPSELARPIFKDYCINKGFTNKCQKRSQLKTLDNENAQKLLRFLNYHDALYEWAYTPKKESHK